VAPNDTRFHHLKLPILSSGDAKPKQPPRPSKTTNKNKLEFEVHSAFLLKKANHLNEYWQRVRAERAEAGSPPVPEEIPLLLKVDPSLNLDTLRTALEFELVSEQEDGFLIVAAKDANLEKLFDVIAKFSTETRGGGQAASIHDLSDEDDQVSRLKRILSDDLFAGWPEIADGANYTVDVGVECVGKLKIPDEPEKTEHDTSESLRRKKERFETKVAQIYEAWDEIKRQRETALDNFVRGYEGEISRMTDNAQAQNLFALPDSFTARITIPGKGLRDLALNFPFIFDISSPDPVSIGTSQTIYGPEGTISASFEAPPGTAPRVCVIDSGLQEQHPIITSAILASDSFCYVPGVASTDVADQVHPSGHGTRVAGAVLFPDSIPRTGSHQLPFWIQNARVLDANNELSNKLFPPVILSKILEKYHCTEGEKTRIFNHSISASRPCPVRHMTAWAAAMDQLSFKHDVLFVQAAGNIPEDSSDIIQRGILQHLGAGSAYPGYLTQGSCRVANPAQSLHSITVGSIAKTTWTNGTLNSFANQDLDPSAFTRTGYGIWGSIKPDVVEFGGDFVSDGANPPAISTPSNVCPELVRATLTPGPAFAADDVGTSYAAPKVAHLAAAIQANLPTESTLLYRALVAHSARWPVWATDYTNKGEEYLKTFGYGMPDRDRALGNNPHRITLYTDGLRKVRAREVQVFQIPIPQSIRSQANEQDVLVEITLAFAAQPRRTRRNLRGYMGVWLDWTTSASNQSARSFLRDVSLQAEAGGYDGDEEFPWALGNRVDRFAILNTKRNLSSLQKDWAIIKAHQLPDNFCVAVVGHPGWDRDPKAEAKYSLAVSFESINKDLEIYTPIQVALDELQVMTESLST
jgi:hypothetical protein